MAFKLKAYNNYLEEELWNFKSIDLEEMNKAKLQNRFDKKYILNQSELKMILPELAKHYSILNINNTVNHSYTSYYFDTTDYDMYLSHHNKRVNRHKVRQRIYNTTGQKFLEIKFKNNKGLTKKTRINTEKVLNTIPYQYNDFITENTIYNAVMLKRVMENNFDRFTLTNEKRTQRITIDTNLSFWLKNKPLTLPNLVIIEVKSTRDDIDNTIFDLLHNHHITPSGMSKYSISLAMLKPDLKQNLFKKKIYSINKITHEL